MTARRVLQLVLFLSLASCAGNRVIGDGKATLTLNRADLRELREAFRTANEKTVSLPTFGEIPCAEYRCTVPISGNAPIYEHEALAGHTKVKGQLAFTPTVPTFLITHSDEAAERDKDFTEAAGTGQASCNARRCVLDFTFARGTTVLLDVKDEHLVWK